MSRSGRGEIVNVIPMRTARRLQTAFDNANNAARTWMDQRANVLEMLGLDPDNLQIGIDFTTGLVSVLPAPTPNAEAIEPTDKTVNANGKSKAKVPA